MLNAVELMGYMVAEPEFKTMTGKEEKEVSIARYRVGVSRDYKEGDSRPVDYINCKAFGSNARYAKDYFHKGDLVVLKGRIVSEPYEKQGEEKKYYTGVLVEKSYLARQKGSTAGHNREMAPGQDIAGGFMPAVQEGEGDFPFLPEDFDFPPIPEEEKMMYPEMK